MPYVLAVAAFWCFWQANEYYNVAPFTDGQWRQLGWTTIAATALVLWRRRAASKP